MQKGCQQRYPAGPGVVAAEPVQPVALDGRCERVARVGAVRFDGVVVRVQQNGRFGRVVVAVKRPDVILFPVHFHAAFLQEFGQQPGGSGFFFAERRGLDHLSQQSDRIFV